MKIYQLKVTIKKSKPPIWWRIWIPAGITFSALSMLLDDFTMNPNSSAFCFSIYQQLELYEATEESPLSPGGFRYDAQEASSTYIDDYFDNAKRFSYEADELQTSIEVEKVFTDSAISAPMLVKTTAQTDVAAVNERLAYYYSLSEREPKFLRKSEIIEFADTEHRLVYTTNPKSAKDNLAKSASHTIQDAAEMLYKTWGLDALLNPDSTEQSVFRRSNIPLRDLLIEETVPKLRKMAAQYSIPHFSVMGTSELCSAIEEQLLKPENMRQQFLSLTEDETAAFDHLIEMGGEWKSDDDRILDAYRNLRIMHYAFLFKDNTIVVPNEVAEAYRQILTPEFCEERQKIHWIENILYSILPPYYGYMPIERFCRLCSRKKNPTIQPDEVMPLYHKIQPEFNTTFLEDDWIADEELLDEKAFQNVRSHHADKPYARIPTNEIETLLKYGYPIHDPYYGKLKIYLLRETAVNVEMADDLLHDLHLQIAYGADMDDIFSLLQDNGVMFSMKSLEGFLPLLQDAFNHTRTFANCGYSPSDIREHFHKAESSDMPRSIAPMSTTAANLLKAAEPDLKRRGMSVDLHSTAMPNPNNTNGKPNRKANKVYPNDPCPCGSGKKYKKCCGRLA